MTSKTLLLSGASGQKYRMKVSTFATLWYSVPTVYAAGVLRRAEFETLFIGSTHDMASRMAWHERYCCLQERGAKHVLALTGFSESVLNAIYDDLVDALKPEHISRRLLRAS